MQTFNATSPARGCEGYVAKRCVAKGCAAPAGTRRRCILRKVSSRASGNSRLPSAHRFQLVDHTGDDAQAAVPELWILGIEPERPQQFGILLGAAGGEHVEIALGKAFGRVLVDGVERVHETIAECIGVDVERRMD